jgi:hypothetical protein
VVAAKYNPLFRFAAFSDSALMSAESSKLDRFVALASYFLCNWYEEGLLVRGGISLGEIEWIDHPALDRDFGYLPNVHYARMYGQAFVDAVELERSGPGAICFLSEAAAELLTTSSPSNVLTGLTGVERPTLVWLDAMRASILRDELSRRVQDTIGQMKRRDHLAATLRYVEELIRVNKFLPPDFSLSALA